MCTQAAEDARRALGDIQDMANLQLQAQEALQRDVQDQVGVSVHPRVRPCVPVPLPQAVGRPACHRSQASACCSCCCF